MSHTLPDPEQVSIESDANARRTSPALVLGACGFIGRHLVTRLLNSGAKVAVITKSKRAYPTPPWASQVAWYETGDSEEENARIYRETVAGARRIFNLAGPSGAAASNADPIPYIWNLRSQIQLLEACSRAGHKPHIVFTSSRLVYGRTGPLPVDEQHPLAPRSIYAAHKICVENYHRVFAQLGALTHTICRISNAYGFDAALSATGYRIINQFIRDSISGKKIVLYGDGSQVRDFVYVDDVVTVLEMVSVHPAARNQLFNIGGGERLTMLEAANLICSLTGGPGIIHAPWPNEHALVESGDYVPSVEKARRMLNFHPAFHFSSGLAATVQATKNAAQRVADATPVT